MKKIVSLVLVIAMCMSMLTITTFAAPTDNITFADGALKQGLINNGADVDGDGEITEAEALTVTQVAIQASSTTYVTTLAGIEYFENLEYLNLYYHSIEDISPLSGLTSLKNLDLGWNYIEDISALSNLTDLEILYLDANGIDNIAVLSNLTALKELWLDDNGIDDIAVLSNLTALEELDLDDNDIDDIAPLSGLTNLQALNLCNNLIDDISSLSTLTELVYLDLDHNEIVDISPISNLTKLETIYLDSNNIADISTLVGMDHINEAYLGNNPLNDENTWANSTCSAILTYGDGDGEWEYEVWVEETYPATTVVLVDPVTGGGIVTVHGASTFNLQGIAKQGESFTYIEELPEGHFSSLALEAIPMPNYTFDHWEDETDMSTTKQAIAFTTNAAIAFNGNAMISDSYAIGDCEAGCTLTEVAFFSPAIEEDGDTLIVEVMDPETGLVNIDVDINVGVGMTGSAITVGALSTSTTTSWSAVFADSIDNYSVELEAVDGVEGYQFGCFNVYVWIDTVLKDSGDTSGYWMHYGTYYDDGMTNDSYLSYVFSQYDIVKVQADYWEMPSLTVQVESSGTGKVEIEGSMDVSNSIISAVAVAKDTTTSEVAIAIGAGSLTTAAVQTIDDSTKTTWTYYFEDFNPYFWNITLSAINSETNYEFDHYLVEYYGYNDDDALKMDSEETWIEYGEFEAEEISEFMKVFIQYKTGHVRVTAYYNYDKPYNPPTKYTLDVSSTEGGSSTFEGTSSHNSGTTVNLDVTTEAGFKFVGWEGDTDAFDPASLSDGDDFDFDVKMTGDVTLKAIFEEIEEEVEEEPEEPVIIEEEETVPETTPVEEEILDAEMPEADVPQTGGFPAEGLALLGATLSGVGLVLKRRKK